MIVSQQPLWIFPWDHPVTLIHKFSRDRLMQGKIAEIRIMGFDRLCQNAKIGRGGWFRTIIKWIIVKTQQ